MTQRPPNRRPKHAKGSGRPGPHGGPNVSLHGDTPDRVTLFGVHAVAAALANPARVVLKIMATENAERRVADAIAERKISVERVRPKDLDRLLGADTVHQGIAAEVRPVEDAELGALVERARGGAPLVVLDQVTDPHNVGAVLRSAAVFGAAGLVMTARHSPPLNGTLAKAASGAMEIVPIALEQNLARTLQALKAEGVKIAGPVKKAILAALSERDEEADICTDKDGNPEPDTDLRDHELVPLKEDWREYAAREVTPFAPDAWVDESYRDARDREVGRVGYEIIFNRYFYRYIPPRPLDEIDEELKTLEAEIAGLLREVAA